MRRLRMELPDFNSCQQVGVQPLAPTIGSLGRKGAPQPGAGLGGALRLSGLRRYQLADVGHQALA